MVKYSSSISAPACPALSHKYSGTGLYTVRMPRGPVQRTGNFAPLRSVRAPFCGHPLQPCTLCSGQARVSISGMWFCATKPAKPLPESEASRLCSWLSPVNSARGSSSQVLARSGSGTLAQCCTGSSTRSSACHSSSAQASCGGVSKRAHSAACGATLRGATGCSAAASGGAGGAGHCRCGGAARRASSFSSASRRKAPISPAGAYQASAPCTAASRTKKGVPPVFSSARAQLCVKFFCAGACTACTWAQATCPCPSRASTAALFSFSVRHMLTGTLGLSRRYSSRRAGAAARAAAESCAVRTPNMVPSRTPLI